MSGFKAHLQDVKSEIVEVSTADASSAHQAGVRFLDVREPDETEQGIISGATVIVRGNLEASVEAEFKDKDESIVVYCAGGTRSAFAAKTLQDLGYTEAWSMDGGFNKWKDEGRPFEIPKVLNSDQRNRYSRHLMLPEIGQTGQQKLLDAKVLLLGAGGLGSPAGLYLAAAGVGTIGIVDMDTVDASNLQRQVIHRTSGIGQPKVDSASAALSALNPDVRIVPHNVRLSAANILDIIADYDLVIDGADNFPTRYLLNDASVKLGIPVVHGSVFRFEGQVTVFDPNSGPTYRDLQPEAPPPELAPNCAEAGVLGVLPGIIGCLQALEAIKLITGIGTPLRGRLLTFNALDMEFFELGISINPKNPVTTAAQDQIQLVEMDALCSATVS